MIAFGDENEDIGNATKITNIMYLMTARMNNDNNDAADDDDL